MLETNFCKTVTFESDFKGYKVTNIQEIASHNLSYHLKGEPPTLFGNVRFRDTLMHVLLGYNTYEGDYERIRVPHRGRRCRRRYDIGLEDLLLHSETDHRTGHTQWNGLHCLSP